MYNFLGLGNFWGSEKSLSIFLAILLAVIFLMPIFPADNLGTKVLLESLVVLLLLSGIFACPTTKLVTALNLTLVALDVIFRVARFTQEYDRTAHAFGIALNTLCILLFVRIIFFQVFKEGDISTQRILGAVSVYMLIGLVWANFYELINLFDPTSFSFPGGLSAEEMQAHPLSTKRQLIYFSFTNLTTTGFGDIVPRSEVARSFSIAEALIGQLYPTILIGRLVSLLATKRA